MGVPFWAGEFAYQWDELWLGGQRFPGLAQLSGPGIKRKLDVKNPKGAAGASLKDEGDELGRIDIKLKLWTEAQLRELEHLLPNIHPRRKGGPKSPLEIYHPLAALLGLKRIYIDQIPIPAHDRKGTLVVNFKAIEWVPRPKPQKKAAGSGGSNKYDDPQDGVTQTIVEELPPPEGSVDNSGMEAAIDAILTGLENTVDNSV